MKEQSRYQSTEEKEIKIEQKARSSDWSMLGRLETQLILSRDV
jgi:hypothetical protein